MPALPSTRPGGPAEAVRPPAAGWPAVFAVTLGLFAIVTTEILPIGLLTSIGADFTVSDGAAGLTMAVPGLLAAVSAPLVTVATAGADRRLVLCVLMLVLTLADVVAAAAPGLPLLLVSRILVGVTIGGFWSVGAGLAERLVPPAAAGRATAVIFLAVPLGSVLGVPAGTLTGDLAGWRTAFVALAVLAAGVLAALLLTVPPLPPLVATRPAVLGEVLRRPGTRAAALLTFLVVLAHFGTYTYVTPFLEQVTGLGDGPVTAFLLAYGAAGVLGNFLGGARATRHPRYVFGAAAGLLAAATLLLPVLGGGPAGALVLLAVWGVAYGAVPVASQALFVRAAPDAPEAASVLFTAAFQATFSLGAFAGGGVLDRTSPAALMTLGGCVAAVAALSAVAARPSGGARPGRVGTPHPRRPHRRRDTL
ncbi:MFS transporter [Streptomyces sp. CA-181903]|uniref:MFS transporter n=1 Tax=Streptomyces sp. CA-181903 TaxID=3240055 RepID=UPI003D90FCEF